MYPSSCFLTCMYTFFCILFFLHVQKLIKEPKPTSATRLSVAYISELEKQSDGTDLHDKLITPRIVTYLQNANPQQHQKVINHLLLGPFSAFPENSTKILV